MLQAQLLAEEERLASELLQQQNEVVTDASKVQLLRSISLTRVDLNDSELPAGWTKLQDENGIRYLNTLSGSTQTGRPFFPGMVVNMGNGIYSISLWCIFYGIRNNGL